MAGEDPNQQYDPNAQYAQGQYQEDYIDEEYVEEEMVGYSDEEGQVAQSLPWMAIALVAHALMLFLASLYYFVSPVAEELDPLSAVTELNTVTPMIKPDDPPELEMPEDVEEVVDPTTNPPTENDDDRSDVDNPNPNKADKKADDAESPNPNNNTNSSTGLGGGAGGGSGGGAGGGRGALGGRGWGRPKRNSDRTDAALQWLADHQNVKGYWDPIHYLDDSIRMKANRNPNGKPAKATRNIDFIDNDAVGREKDVGYEWTPRRPDRPCPAGLCWRRSHAPRR